MILTQIRDRVERWFNRIVNQAIIDAVSYQPDPTEDERRQNNLFVTGTALWFVLVTVGTYVAVFGGGA